MIFNVTMVTFWMTLLINKFTNIVMDDINLDEKPCHLVSDNNCSTVDLESLKDITRNDKYFWVNI